jgi:predicted NAD-dependent protein-ADP-ribosyltransferase YbiA (DUF1768 family)
MKATLLATANKTLAEGSRDTWWGTGKSIYAKTAFDGWTGANHMGDILMRVRMALKGS